LICLSRVAVSIRQQSGDKSTGTSRRHYTVTCAADSLVSPSCPCTTAQAVHDGVAAASPATGGPAGPRS
jgi:hypothetical protein